MPSRLSDLSLDDYRDRRIREELHREPRYVERKSRIAFLV